jgi:hypothetical protein
LLDDALKPRQVSGDQRPRAIGHRGPVVAQHSQKWSNRRERGRPITRAQGTSAPLALAIAAVLLLVSGASRAVAHPPDDASYHDHAVDSLICGFPLEGDLAADSHMRFVPGNGAQPQVLFPTTLVIGLRNLLTGRSATLRDAEPTSFDFDDASFTFTGSVLITRGPFPFARLRGSATVGLDDFVISRFRGAQEVVDVCGLVEPSATESAPRATSPPWDAGTNPLAAMKRAGLTPHVFAAAEHMHAHLDVFVNGAAVPVPAGIGVVAPIDTGATNIQSAWGVMAPVHTHDPDGILHVHTGIPERFTLGQFFDVWRVRLTDRCLGSTCVGPAGTLRTYVNGNLVSGGPRDVVIRPRDEIAIVFGPPGVPSAIPSSYDFPPGLAQFGFPG